MAKIWFSSDLHLNHNKDFIYKHRGFETVEEMDEEIIKRFNEVVDYEDTLYILGDVALGDKDNGRALFERLPLCNLYIVAGNHDTNNRYNYYKKSPRVRKISFGERLPLRGWTVLLSHYPMLVGGHESYTKRKLINLSGHTHSSDKFALMDEGIYNVSVDAHDCYPVEIDTIINDIKAYQKR